MSASPSVVFFWVSFGVDVTINLRKILSGLSTEQEKNRPN
jgi:hypothetical protein